MVRFVVTLYAAAFVVAEFCCDTKPGHTEWIFLSIMILIAYSHYDILKEIKKNNSNKPHKN